jgi:hypothetical protein
VPVAGVQQRDEGRVVGVGQDPHPQVQSEVPSGDPQVEQRRTAGDEKGPSRRVGVRQLPGRVGVELDVAVADGERPRLGVVQ